MNVCSCLCVCACMCLLMCVCQNIFSAPKIKLQPYARVLLLIYAFYYHERNKPILLKCGKDMKVCITN